MSNMTPEDLESYMIAVAESEDEIIRTLPENIVLIGADIIHENADCGDMIRPHELAGRVFAAMFVKWLEMSIINRKKYVA